MKTIGFKVIDRLFIVVYGAADPTEDDWNEYLEDVMRHGIDRTMHLVLTDGGGPNAGQRRRLEHVLAGRTVPVAVMSDLWSIRCIVTAMSWVNREIRFFPTTGLDDALAHLEIPSSRASLIAREAGKLRSFVRRPCPLVADGLARCSGGLS